MQKLLLGPLQASKTEDLSSVHMVTALLLAGLYPNVARIDVPKAKKRGVGSDAFEDEGFLL